MLAQLLLHFLSRY